MMLRGTAKGWVYAMHITYLIMFELASTGNVMDVMGEGEFHQDSHVIF